MMCHNSESNVQYLIYAISSFMVGINLACDKDFAKTTMVQLSNKQTDFLISRAIIHHSESSFSGQFYPGGGG